ncbi:MAG: PilT/PilU family type 4a pilus ATPase [Candidatus Omnitrophica bacterium]|nr:PilT/PilU family type 4a pilus ATPase [Candidatus Omnitrophota bacterium]
MSHHSSIEKESASLPSDFIGITGRGVPVLQPPTAITHSTSLNEILILARSENASDMHLSANKPVVFRQFGRLRTMAEDILTADRIHSLITAALPGNVFKDFESTGDGEYVHTIVGYGRFRMTFMKQSNGWDLTARLIPMNIPTFEESKMPVSCANLTKWAQGLVLITGPAGCGKTTTLAVLVELINQARHDHIITIEQPIEIVYEPKQSQITQREINLHSLSQLRALRAALREDPDILVVSELRDLQSVQLAISASETGHLVIGTMNTVNAAQTISRVIDSFPLEEQPIIRNMISESLRGVICQQLIPRKNGTGVVPAYEVLIVNQSVSNLIRKGEMNQINNAITTGKLSGMILMDNSLETLALNGVISVQEACERATNPAAMAQLLVKD